MIDLDKHFIGLDIGTVYTRVCDTRYNATLGQYEVPAPVRFGAQRAPSLRSLLLLDGSGQHAAGVGREALEDPDARRHPERLHAGFVAQLEEGPDAASPTCMFAAQVARRVAEEHFNAEGLSADAFATVVGVPASWTEARSARLCQTVEAAGFPNVSAVSAPVAAVQCHAFAGDIALEPRPQRWLVLDCGGAAMTAALVETDGRGAEGLSTPLDSVAVGGEAFDRCLLGAWLWPTYGLEAQMPQQTRLLEFVRELKEGFSQAILQGKNTYSLYPDMPGLRSPVTLTQAEFAAATQPLLDRIWAVWPRFPADVDGAVLTGGGANWHFMREAADKFYTGKWVVAPDPALTLARGLALALTGFRPPTRHTEPVLPEIIEVRPGPVEPALPSAEPGVEALERALAGSRARARTLAKRWAVAGGVLALLVSPIPGVSQPFLTAIEIKLILDIAKLYGFRLKLEDVMGTLLLLFVLGSLVKWAVMEAATLIPFAGWAIKGGVAAAAIYGWAEAALHIFEARRRKMQALPHDDPERGA